MSNNANAARLTLGAVLLYTPGMGREQFSAGGQCGKRLKNQGMDETAVLLFCACRDFIYLYLWNVHVSVALEEKRQKLFLSLFSIFMHIKLWEQALFTLLLA